MKTKLLSLLLAIILVSAAVADDWDCFAGNQAVCAWTTFAALGELEKISGGSFHGNSERQQQLLRIYNTNRDKLAAIPEVKASVGKIEEVNRALQDAGFPIQLPAGSPQDVAAAGMLDYRFDWKAVGTPWRFDLDQKRFRAFRLKEASGLFFVKAKSDNQIICAIPTTSGDTVCLAKRDVCPANFQDVIAGWTDDYTATDEYNAADLPEIDMTAKVDLGWLQGISHGRDRIEKAIQAISFQMDASGGRAKAATAMSMSRGLDFCRPLQFDGPFLIWVQRSPQFGDPLPSPLFALWVTPQNWVSAEVPNPPIGG